MMHIDINACALPAKLYTVHSSVQPTHTWAAALMHTACFISAKDHNRSWGNTIHLSLQFTQSILQRLGEPQLTVWCHEI